MSTGGTETAKDLQLCLSLREWDEVSGNEDVRLKGLRLPASPEDRSTVDAINRSGCLGFEELHDGLRIRSTSWVGRVQLGNLQVTVRPKLEGMPLLNLLRYAFQLRQLRVFPEATFATESSSFQDILILQLLSEVGELIARGLVRNYQRIDERLASPRGRIDINRIANGGMGGEAALPCSYFPRRTDWLANQLLMAGLKLAARLATEPLLRTRARRLYTMMSEDISDVPLSQSTFSQYRRVRNRLIAAYDPAIRIIYELARSAGLTLQHDDDLAVPGFLFDMNRFFQALLSRFLQDNLAPFKVKDEHTLRHMMAYLPDQNPLGRPDPKPRPDFAVSRGSTVVSLMDAKYRDLWNRNLPREMLYQLAIYALSQPHARNAAILYPTIGPTAKESRIEIRDPLDGAGTAWITQRPVDLIELEALVSKQAETAERRRYAKYLAFGPG